MYSLILLNGGIGQRVGRGQPKQFLRVNGLPIIVYSMVAADAVDVIDEIVVNFPDGWRGEVEKVVADYAVHTPVKFVPAGTSRHDSVGRMLPYCKNEHIILHETARPVISAADFEKIAGDPRDNVSYMLPISFTVAPVDPDTESVTGSLDRSKLRNVQLPQKFRKADLLAAHEYAAREGLRFTEDATLCAVAGSDVHFLDGHDANLKVTTRTDVKLASFLLSRQDKDE